MKKSLFSLIIALLTYFSGQSQNLYFPPVNGIWETMEPAELNWCPEKIDSLYSMLDEKGTKGFIVLKEGRIVLERYFGGFTQDSFWYWASAGKSLAAFLVGMAQQEGLLDIQDPVNQYLGNGWTSCTPAQEDQIRIWHQITMTTGLDERNVNLDCLDPECLKYRTEPGSRWYYHNAPYRLVQDVVANAAGMSFQQFTSSKLRNSIGLTGLWFNYVFYSQPRSMARFGLLMLAEGNWNGREIMTDREYLRMMTETSQPHNKAYGYLWWLNGKDSYQLPGLPVALNGEIVESAPDDMYAALGKNDQKIYVVPSQNMVVIRMGENAGEAPVSSLSSFDNILWSRLSNLECSTTSTYSITPGTFHVYPNPVEREINMSGLPSGSNWRLLDLYGRTIRRGIWTGIPIQAGDLPAGHYQLICTDDSGHPSGISRIFKL